MKSRRDAFLAQLKRAQEAKREPRPRPGAKLDVRAPEQMSGEELADAITAARRELLDAQRAELREQEKARVSGEARSPVESRQFIPQQRPKHWR